MSYGSIYPLSWWGNANEANGWGIVYPTNAGGSTLTVVLDNGESVTLNSISGATISGTYTIGATGSGEDRSTCRV